MPPSPMSRSASRTLLLICTGMMLLPRSRHPARRSTPSRGSRAGRSRPALRLLSHLRQHLVLVMRRAFPSGEDLDVLVRKPGRVEVARRMGGCGRPAYGACCRRRGRARWRVPRRSREADWSRSAGRVVPEGQTGSRRARQLLELAREQRASRDVRLQRAGSVGYRHSLSFIASLPPRSRRRSSPSAGSSRRARRARTGDVDRVPPESG